MPRKARKHSITNIYHVVIKGIDRQIIFENHKDYKKYIELLDFYKENCHFRLFAYCLMSNHVHLLLQTTDISLESIFRRINTHYAVWFNMKYQRTGHVQDGRFFSETVEDANYLLNAIKYIHLNPTKAGLEPYPGHSYPWSSIHEYAENVSNLVDTSHILAIFNLDELLSYDVPSNNTTFTDIDKIKKRLPDDVAKDIIIQECNCYTVSDFLALPLKSRNNYIQKLYSHGLSIRQLNRLTGVSRGVIQRLVSKGHS